jgi:membrane-bound serine protease (ClpP class)
VLFLLLLGALAGIGTELSHPGLLLPGIVGVFCLVLFLFAAQVLPVSGAGVLLVLLGVLLFVAEAKVTSYGLLTLGGIVAMILGGSMLVEGDIPELRVGLELLVPMALAAGLWAALLVRLVLASRRRAPTTGSEGLVGAPGRVETDLAPEGWVFVAGERWRAVAPEPLAAGTAVVVTAVQGLKLHVRKEG